MSWVADTLEAFQAWLGATPVDDVAASRALTLALVAVETWLDRPLELEERVQESYNTDSVVRLRAWPVESVSSVTIVNGPDLDVDMLALDKRVGHLFVPGLWTSSVVTYTGGLDPFPADLEFALWQVAAVLYPGMLAASGAGSGQAIKRVTTPDVGTIEFANTAAAAAGAAGNALLGGALSPQVEALLARYRAESVVGGA